MKKRKKLLEAQGKQVSYEDDKIVFLGYNDSKSRSNSQHFKNNQTQSRGASKMRQTQDEGVESRPYENSFQKQPTKILNPVKAMNTIQIEPSSELARPPSRAPSNLSTDGARRLRQRSVSGSSAHSQKRDLAPVEAAAGKGHDGFSGGHQVRPTKAPEFVAVGEAKHLNPQRLRNAGAVHLDSHQYSEHSLLQPTKQLKSSDSTQTRAPGTVPKQVSTKASEQVHHANLAFEIKSLKAIKAGERNSSKELKQSKRNQVGNSSARSKSEKKSTKNKHPGRDRSDSHLTNRSRNSSIKSRHSFGGESKKSEK